MSEYQFVAFEAVDRVLTDAELRFMRTQSSRAEITRSSFRNEYQFGDFRGDVEKMMHAGFDVHLHYANFGIRKVVFKLPSELPFSEDDIELYLGVETIEWSTGEKSPSRRKSAGKTKNKKKATQSVDTKPSTRLLTLDTSGDAGTFAELYEYDLDDFVSAAVAVRELLLAGDLRGLYILWLCAQAGDSGDDPDEVIEPPIPPGLSDVSGEAKLFLTFFWNRKELLEAAATGNQAKVAKKADPLDINPWISQQSLPNAQRLLARFLQEDPATVKAEIIATIRRTKPMQDSSTNLVDLGRTLTELLDEADETEQRKFAQAKRQAELRREAAAKKEAEARAKRIAEMEATDDVNKYLKQAKDLIRGRGSKNYQAAAELLADLSQAVGGRVVSEYVQLVLAQHPTLSRLKGAFRKEGVL